MNKWKVIKESVDYQNPYFKVIKKELISPSGKKNDYYVLDRCNFGIPLPIIDDKFLMVNQYRQTVGRNSLEFPMGGSNEGETLEDCAKRELIEETGHKASKLTFLGHATVASDHSCQQFEVFLAEGLTDIERKNLDEAEEGIENELIKIADFPKLVKEGTIIDGPTLAAYALYQIHLLKVESS